MIPPESKGFIGVFDSGIGGLSVANAVSGRLPREKLIYVADNAYAPYGPRSATEITDRSRRLTKALTAAGAKLILIACNSATTAAVATLREEFPGVPFVAMEPAVKPAASYERVGVIATAATLGSRQYDALREDYLGDHFVWEYHCPGLVELIEKYSPDGPEIRGYLSEALAPAFAQKIDALVLGCTHYLLLKPVLRDVLGTGVDLIDPAPPTARRLAWVLENEGLLGEEDQPEPRHDFYTTGPSVALQRTLASLPELNAKRCWVIPRLAL